MTPDDWFVTDPTVFDTVIVDVDQCFWRERQLPQQVFRHGMARVQFFEFGEVVTAEFWRILASLGRHYRDNEVLVTTIDPTPQYFHDHFGYFGLLRLPVNPDPERYIAAWRFAPEKSRADSLNDHGEVLAYTGTSGGWGVWADREFGIAIIGVRATDGIEPPAKLVSNGIQFKSLEVSVDIIGLAWAGSVAPADFRDEFRRNYGRSFY